mmetsp:Transcript_29631/g.65264  ORF Transcript_29631/g.65264 Transcript_29631/m.65264 type:complete len:338 (-) Transcript_29631:104-1117(-)
MAHRCFLLLISSFFGAPVLVAAFAVNRPNAARSSVLSVPTVLVSDTICVGTFRHGRGDTYKSGPRCNSVGITRSTSLLASSDGSNNGGDGKDSTGAGTSGRKIGLAPLETKASTIEEIAAAAEQGSKQDDGNGGGAEDADDPTVAATNTVNARLQAELAAAAEAERAGGKSKLSKRVRAAFRSEKTDEERQRSIEEARNLNGVNPLVAGGSGLLAFVGSYGLWTATTFIADLFAKNPVETDFYTAARLSGVFRNVIVGLFSLASGFSGVIGLGLVLLAGRVAYGVLTGELDPTPIRKNRGEEIAMPNVLDLMMNKKPGRRGGRKKGRSSSDDNQFGL